jgi:hypothetical protein
LALFSRIALTAGSSFLALRNAFN